MDVPYYKNLNTEIIGVIWSNKYWLTHREGDSYLLRLSELLFLLDFIDRSSTPSIDMEPLLYW